MIADLRRTAQFIASHPVGSRNKLAAWRRWLHWQLLSRVAPRPRTMPWIGDSCLVVERGMTGATGNLYCGLHEFNDMALMLHYLLGATASQQPASFLDVGANVGSYAILASKVCGAPGLALEPAPTTFRRLVRNIEANGVGALVETHCVAAGTAEGVMRFTADLDTMNRRWVEGASQNTIDVAVRPVDSFPAARTAAFWKVDVEGAESDILAGAQASLAQDAVQVVLLEANDAEIEGTMHNAGFQAASYDPWTRSLSKTPLETIGGNHVWVRDAQRTQSQCRLAAMTTIFGVVV